MPPVTPRMTRATSSSCQKENTAPAGDVGRCGPRGRRGSLRAALGLDLALGDLLERDREVVLRARLDERRREVVEGAFAQLMVVVVDLAGALGCDDHER